MALGEEPHVLDGLHVMPGEAQPREPGIVGVGGVHHQHPPDAEERSDAAQFFDRIENVPMRGFRWADEVLK